MKKAVRYLFLLCCLAAVVTHAQNDHPVAHLGSISSTMYKMNGNVPIPNCTKAEILSNPVLAITGNCEVIDSSFSYMQGEATPIHVRGSRLTNEILEHIKQLKGGTSIIIYGINVNCNCKTTWAEPIELLYNH